MSSDAADDTQAVIHVSGSVLSAAGEPAVGAVVRATLSAKQIDQTAIVGDDGKFSLAIPIEKKLARAVRFRCENLGRDELAFAWFPYDTEIAKELPTLDIKLAKVTSSFLLVTDEEGKPINDANVVVQLNYQTKLDNLVTDRNGKVSFRFPGDERIMAAVAWKDNAGLDYKLYKISRDRRADATAKAPEFPIESGETLQLSGAKPLAIEVVDDAGKPIPDVDLYPWLLQKPTREDQLNLSFFSELRGKSNEDGQHTFAWFPKWQTQTTTIWPNITGYIRDRQAYNPGTDNGELKIQLTSQVPVTGTVLNPDGSPVGGVTVSAFGEGYGWDDSRENTTTDEDGQYELFLAPEKIYLLVAGNEQWASNRVPSFVVRAETPIRDKDITLCKPTRVFGVLTNSLDGKPIANRRVFVYQYGDSLSSMEGVSLDNPENSRKWVCPIRTMNETTDDHGRYEFRLGGGSYDLRPPEQEKVEKFEIERQAELEINLSTDKANTIEMVGTVVDGDGKLVEDANVHGVPQDSGGNDWQAVTDARGTFQVECYPEPTYVHAVNRDKTLGSISVLDAKTPQPKLVLLKTGSVRGRLISPDSDAAWTNKTSAMVLMSPVSNTRAGAHDSAAV